jgi:hypothetical protein
LITSRCPHGMPGSVARNLTRQWEDLHEGVFETSNCNRSQEHCEAP